ncbi:uncharacterized protein LOC130034360 [Sorex fumeus]|uniref:uncharacterized protein LOC130034360 n=1 Tax=Sorex fumeus TaxID=62283 RepID=UPI0024AD5ADB|nr:uncharacterized protein LOC130034360 [Sorex fumeus]
MRLRREGSVPRSPPPPSAELARRAPPQPGPDSQTGKSIQLAPESQLKDVKPTLLSLRPEQQTIKSAELGPVQQLQSNKHIDLTPSSQLKGAEQLNLSIPPVLPDIKSTELRKRSLQRDTKLKLIESVPKLSLQDLRSEKMLSPTLMTKGMEMPQVAECRRLISETQKQGKKYEELDPGGRVQAVKSIELKSSNTDPEGLTSGHQTLESLEMISEPEYQDTKTKLNFDTCHQTKESVGSIQSSSRDTPGPLSQASESIQVNSESLQSTPNTLQSMQFMRDKPVSQYTIRRTPKLVPISEMQDAESEVLIPEPQD